ncbi:hypothetical protein [Yersinia mollaretii]|uniref:hypothetical protein n=1 Tax=Yersinia mollaretii TaxID=33060 RepID=UPI000B21F10B|nr:hypothetical protein [Yersinia mollaretii]
MDGTNIPRKGLSSWERVSPGSISQQAAGGHCDSSNISRKPQVQEGRPALLLG